MRPYQPSTWLRSLATMLKIFDAIMLLIIRLMVESRKISAEDKKESWLDIGMLLFLVKHSSPDIANATWEL